jgi:tRNA-splicing ligase RtcB
MTFHFRGVELRKMMDQRVAAFGTELRGGGLDESPHCYKPLADVLAAHEGTIIESCIYK